MILAIPGSITGNEGLMLKKLLSAACFLCTISHATESKSALECKLVVSDSSKVSPFQRRDNIDDINPPTSKDYANAAQAVVGTIEGVYGPMIMKDESIGLNWEKMVTKLYETVGQIQNPKEFFFEISNFIYQLKDSHVSVTLPSTLSWKLPFQMTYSVKENVYFINYFEPEAMAKVIKKGEMPPLGAELLKVNGEDIHTLQKRSYFDDAANEITSKALFARTITRLSEARGVPLSLFPSRLWTFTFLFPDGKIHDVTMEYQASGVGLLALDTILPIASSPLASAVPVTSNTSSLSQRSQFVQIERLMMDANELVNLKKDSKDTEIVETKGLAVGRPYRIGARLPNYKLPENFKAIELPGFVSAMFTNGGHLFAGTFPHQGKRVGLLRIPSYGPDPITAAPIELRYLIHKLEKESDYLIIDQLDNPGGYVSYVDMVTKAFVGNLDLQRHMKFRLKPTHNYLQDFAELTQSLDSMAVTPEQKAMAKLVREQFEILHRAYRTGEPVSDPITWTVTSEFFLSQLIAAHKEAGTFDLIKAFTGADLTENQVYTKPVYMLINQLDFSGGDATPAILQDYKRVTLIGQRTAGAGGPVRNFQENKRALEIEYSLTTGLMFRPTRQNPYVENYGVQPDIQLDMTKDDFLDGDTYLNKVLHSINK